MYQGRDCQRQVLMARSIALFRLFARRKLAADIIARGINDEIYSHGTADKFVTSVIGWYDLEDHKISFVNCGHNPVLFVNETQSKIYETSAPPMGVVSQDEFEPKLSEFMLKENNAMYIATDGITEGMLKVNQHKSMELGMEGLTKLAQKHLALDAVTQVDQVLDLIRTQKMTVNDDSTLLVIARHKPL